MATYEILKGQFYDGPLTLPTEVEGSGAIALDSITQAQVLTRKYVQLQSLYVPPIPNSSSYPDKIFPGLWFVSEKIDKIENGLTCFTRIFCSVPMPRVERRLISFTYPGRSAAYTSRSSGGYIGWNQYGGGAPKTRLEPVQVQYTYVLVVSPILDPYNVFPNPPQPSAITYNGKLVDFVGDVYAPSGPSYQSGNRVEQSWAYQGTTSPSGGQIGSVVPWVIAVDQRRYMGPIWEQAVTQFPNGLLYV